jgi:hypothetical protein
MDHGAATPRTGDRGGYALVRALDVVVAHEAVEGPLQGRAIG